MHYSIVKITTTSVKKISPYKKLFMHSKVIYFHLSIHRKPWKKKIWLIKKYKVQGKNYVAKSVTSTYIFD